MRVLGVGKRYRGRWIFRDVDLEAPAGSITVIQGSNGSGKSTLLRVLAGLTAPTVGHVHRTREGIAYVPDGALAVSSVPARTYIESLGRLRGLSSRDAHPAAVRLLEEFNFTGGAEAPCRVLSKGNRQKVLICQAFMSRVGTIILDEPWSGLDTQASGALSTRVRGAAEDGAAVILTDHQGVAVRIPHAEVHLLDRGGLRTPEWDSAANTDWVMEVQLVRMEASGTAVEWVDLPGIVEVLGGSHQVRARVEESCCSNLLATALNAGWFVEGVRRLSDREHLIEGNE